MTMKFWQMFHTFTQKAQFKSLSTFYFEQALSKPKRIKNKLLKKLTATLQLH